MTRFALTLTLALAVAAPLRADVVLQKTPNKGIQPQLMSDARGNVHLLYYDGDARGGNLFYVKRDAGQAAFSTPTQVNSGAGSAVAAGTIRGGQLALGKDGRVHVSWNGAMKAEPKNPLGGHPMLYARLSDDGKTFEKQRNLMTQTSVLDGGGTLAADAKGNVYVAWHALGKDNAKGEGNRKVWVAVSSDDGKTFAAEKPAWDGNTGACGCCGMRGFADSKGNIYFLYRAASEKTNRGMYALMSRDRGTNFFGNHLDNWKIATCPMSSEAIAENNAGHVFAAWENEGQIYVRQLLDSRLHNAPNRALPGKGGDRAHPAIAFNKNGEMLVAWTEGTGWNKGGALAWQVFDKNMQPTLYAGRRPGAIGVWGLPAVVAEADGRFTIYH